MGCPWVQISKTPLTKFKKVDVKKIDVSSRKFNSIYEMIYWRFVSSSAGNVVKESLDSLKVVRKNRIFIRL